MKLCILILMMNVAGCSLGQGQVFIEKVDPSENLAEIILELSDSQQECDYYTPSLMYLIRDISESGSFKLSITMIEGLEFIPKQMLGDIVGYFDSDGRTVLLMGERLKKLSSNLQTKKEFAYDEDFEVYPSDYSLWIYELKGDELVELESFKIPCD